MSEALALDAAWLFAVFLLVLVLAAAGIAVRRFLLERGGATVECGLRRERGSWRLGVASYQVDEFCWFGVFGISMRPDETFRRRDLTVVSRRPLTEAEETILGPGRIVVECQLSDDGAPGPVGQAVVPSQAGASGEGGATGEGSATGHVGGSGQAMASGQAGASAQAAASWQAGASGVGGRPGPGDAYRAVELALAESALTGLLAWLEAGPPGSHLAP